jgi:hypothetical protein
MEAADKPGEARMNEAEANRVVADFDMALAAATSSEQAWRALQTLASALAGCRLFTVMTVDLAKGEARRAYTSHPVEYPVSGTKPIHRDAWFDIVCDQQRSFVANTIADIAKVFPDYELIRSLGCGSVVNLPVIADGQLAATINLLDAEQHYGPERVRLIETHLSGPARRAVAFDLSGKNTD